MKKFKLFSFLLVLFIAIFIWGALSVENKNTSPFVNSIKSIIPQNIKATLKNTLFIIPTLSKKVESQKNRIIELEAKVLELSKQVNYLIDKLELKQNLSKNIKSKLNTYNISSYKLPFLTRKEGHGKPAAYLEQKGNNILIATGRGEFFTFKKEDIESKTLNLKKIKSNIKNVIKNEEFYSKGKIGIRDLMILDNKIYFSYIKEQKYGCYNTSIIFS